MPLQYEAFVPMAIISAMFGVAGVGYNFVHKARNEGKPPRYNLDSWDKLMMERDLRMTGTWRGQNDNLFAPPEFKTNSIWHVYEKLD